MQLLTPEAKQSTPDLSPSPSLGTAQVAGTCFITCLNSKWIIDSGATNHICSSLDLFTSYSVFDKLSNTITVADGKQIKVQHIGTVVFEDGIKLENVLHVPGLKFNLISTHKLCRDTNCDILFTSDSCLLQDNSKQTSVVLGKVDSGLYALSHLDTSSSVTHAAAVTNEDAKLWHLRFGHLPFDKLYHVCSDVSSHPNVDCFCQICPKAKQSKLSFPISVSTTSRCFELLHIDVWGPYKIHTHDGCNMFLTIVDDFSRHTWVFLLKHKSDVHIIMSNFLSYIENQFSTTVLIDY